VVAAVHGAAAQIVGVDALKNVLGRSRPRT